jgi:hypothetical protein
VLTSWSRAAFLLLVATSCNGMRTQEHVRGERVTAPTLSIATPLGTAEVERRDTDSTAELLPASTRAFLDGLGEKAHREAQLAFSSGEREDWNYVPRNRAGLALGAMTDRDRKALHALLGAGLSQEGHRKVEGILRLEGILGGLEGNPGFRDPGRYHLAVFGEPTVTGPWGFRFEGHHLSLNFTQAGKRVATTPAFLGANPAEVPSGPQKGMRVLAAEEDLGRRLLASLSDEQRRRAVIATTAPSDIVTVASRRAVLARFEGLPAADMTSSQRADLMALLEVYLRNFPSDLASGHRERIQRAGIERLHFAWAGSAEPRQAHYYRIHGPSHLIEYDNRGNHIHTVLRELENDFGESLLAQHLQEHHGAGAGDPHR